MQALRVEVVAVFKTGHVGLGCPWLTRQLPIEQSGGKKTIHNIHRGLGFVFSEVDKCIYLRPVFLVHCACCSQCVSVICMC